MATKVIELAGVGPVTLVKRTGNRSLRLSVTTSGVRVSMPYWTSYGDGQAFAEHHVTWIQTELARHSSSLLEAGQRIGKLHYLRFEQVLNGQATTSRVTGTEVVVRMQPSEAVSDPKVQARARTACIRALKREAERLLPPRLQNLATKHGKSYRSVCVKLLKRRWGSCNNHQEITLNLYLMELPWEYIDYVLMHELTHTLEMNHGSGFWRILTGMEPRARRLSKELRAHHPNIGDWNMAEH